MVFMKIVEDGIFRFDCTEEARGKAWPSLSFEHPAKREMPLEDVPSQTNRPEFLPSCTLENERQIVTIKLPSGTSFYGTGEVSGSLERTGTRIFTWNSDAWAYGPSTTSLYQSHPWVFALLQDGRAFGVLADTSRRCEVDLRKHSTIKFVAPSFYPVVTFGPYASPTTLITALSHAVGTISMPPKWSLGYHQSRWSYEPASRVLEVAKTFREKKIPCDVIWMDIDYMDKFACFTFDHEKFPDPQGLAKSLHDNGFKAVWMIDPGIKAETGYSVYDSGSSEDAWILESNGKPYLGEVWPGPCAFPDFSTSKVRKWWAGLVSRFLSNGVDGIWNDMNEPTVFKNVTKSMPESNIHRGDADLGGSQRHSHYHNVYGLLMARSTHEGMLLGNSTKRPFVLTRAGSIGSQRYAATWTGDNLSTWDHLRMSIPMALNLGLSGQPFSGPDIGGFAGDATPKLFGRWMGIGALLPFCRGHSEAGTVDHEPWSFGVECEKVCRLALDRRYRLLLHFYTLFYKAHMIGVPVITPLFFADPNDLKLRSIEDSFLLGPLLVSASIDQRKGSSAKKTVLPSGIWQEFNFDDDHDDLPLLYLKGGSIIPIGPSTQHTGEMDVSNDLTLLVALNENGKAEGLLYEDDGDGFDYQRGKYILTSYEAALQDNKVVVKIGSSEGSLPRPRRKLNIHLLLGATARVVASGFDGEDISFELPNATDVATLMAERQRMESCIWESLQDEEESQDALGNPKSTRTMVELNAHDWRLKVVPWIGGRITSMIHVPTGMEWLWSRLEKSGYEEYSDTGYHSPGCCEEYNVVRQDICQMGGNESILMEGDIGGGLLLQRHVVLSKDSPQLLLINSSIMTKSNLAGSGGFSRMACLRVHPTFQLRNPMETMIRFTSIDGKNHSVRIDGKELCFRGDKRPRGEWMLLDECANVALVNRFKLQEVEQCSICWGPGTCSLELWSTERPVSKETAITICHEYETVLQDS